MLAFLVLCVIAAAGWFFWKKKSSQRSRVRQSAVSRQEPTITQIDGPIIKRTAPDQVELNLDPLNMPLWADAQVVEVNEPVITEDSYEEVDVEAELDTALDELQAEMIPEEDEEAAEQEPSPPAPESLVVAFAVMAQVGKTFSGQDILDLFSNLELTFSEGSGFYIKTEISSTDTPLFTIANMVTPGTFDPTLFVSQTSPGLLLFARLETSSLAWQQFEAIVETAETLTERLDGVLCDDQHKAISPERLVELQNEVAAAIATYS